MDILELAIIGACELTPQIHSDDRGDFLEWFRADELREITGHPFTLAQANCSVSRAGTLRGIHFAELPPGQAKFVTCMHGSIVDVVVDIRTGSPTYGQWQAVTLDDSRRNAVYLGEGLGHAFLALEDDTVVSYLCSAPYAPGREHGINPLDPTIGIKWPATGADGRTLDLLLSEKDGASPSLDEARLAGLLPAMAEVETYLAGLAADG